MLCQHAFVVDRNLRGLDFAVDDRQHGRLLPRKGHGRVDFVLKQLAHIAGLGDRLNALAELPFIRFVGRRFFSQLPVRELLALLLLTPLSHRGGQSGFGRRSAGRRSSGELHFLSGQILPIRLRRERSKQLVLHLGPRYVERPVKVHNEVDRPAADQRQSHVVPVFFGRVFDDSPTLQHGLGVFFFLVEHQAVASLPDGQYLGCNPRVPGAIPRRGSPA